MLWERGSRLWFPSSFLTHRERGGARGLEGERDAEMDAKRAKKAAARTRVVIYSRRLFNREMKTEHFSSENVGFMGGGHTGVFLKPLFTVFPLIPFLPHFSALIRRTVAEFGLPKNSPKPKIFREVKEVFGGSWLGRGLVNN